MYGKDFYELHINFFHATRLQRLQLKYYNNVLKERVCVKDKERERKRDR